MGRTAFGSRGFCPLFREQGAASRAQRARAIGIWGISSGLGTGFGPIVGGALTDWFGWRSVFVANAAIGTIALLIVLRVVPASRSATARKIDVRGQVLVAAFLATLTYSLIEPMTSAGFAVGDLDGLTGLAEYRNGGLFIDTGVLIARNPSLLHQELVMESEAVVEWRALTVALLDRIAPLVKHKLGLARDAL